MWLNRNFINCEVACTLPEGQDVNYYYPYCFCHQLAPKDSGKLVVLNGSSHVIFIYFVVSTHVYVVLRGKASTVGFRWESTGMSLSVKSQTDTVVCGHWCLISFQNTTSSGHTNNTFLSFWNSNVDICYLEHFRQGV